MTQTCVIYITSFHVCSDNTGLQTQTLSHTEKPLIQQDIDACFAYSIPPVYICCCACCQSKTVFMFLVCPVAMFSVCTCVCVCLSLWLPSSVFNNPVLLGQCLLLSLYLNPLPSFCSCEMDFVLHLFIMVKFSFSCYLVSCSCSFVLGRWVPW